MSVRFKKILRNLNLLNIVLVAATVLFASYWLSPLMAAKIKYALPSVKKAAEVTGKEKELQPQTPSVTEYTAVAEDNLFHPERRIPPEKNAEEAPLPKPDFILYGTLLTDDLKLAYLEDLKSPRTTPGRGKRQVALKKGDTMSGYTVREIDADKVVMARGAEKVIVPINDPAHPKTREGQTTAVTEKTQAVPANVPAHMLPASKQRSRSEHKSLDKIRQPATRSAAPAIQSASASRPAPSSTGATQNFLNFFQRGRK
jgi:hypothetical protein